MTTPDPDGENKEVMLQLMDQLGKKGFFFVGLIAYREGVSDSESVRVGCAADFYSHPKMRPIVIRMLRNAATILEAGAGHGVVEVLDPESDAGMERLRKEAEALGLGATGRQPQGTLGPGDQGELRAALTVKNGKLVLLFGKPVEFLAMNREQGMAIGTAIRDKAAALPRDAR